MRRDQSPWWSRGYTSQWWDALPRAEREVFLAGLTREQQEDFFRDWRVWAHDYQIPPETDWDTWLFMAGRGSGKTSAAVEYIIDCVNQGWARRIAIVGQGEDDVRQVMVQGQSGFIERSSSTLKPTFRPSVGGGQVIWPNGCVAYIYSIADTEALRGPEFHLGWCDEPMAAPRAQRERALDNLEFCLRLGKHPQLILTTTPKRDPWLKQMETEAKNPENKILLTGATTFDNERNLPANFLRKITRKYAGTRIERQEIMGQILGDEAGALWNEEGLDKLRLDALDPQDVAEMCDRIVVGVDPNTKDESKKPSRTSHAAGIVVIGAKGRERYVLADRSISGGPSKWASAVVKAAIDFGASEIVAESNQGGDMVKIVVNQAMEDTDCNASVHLHFSRKNKQGRAEPVATMYDRGLVHHVGPKKNLELLETQMLYLHEGQDPTKEDYDRCDALVWGLTRLGLKKRAVSVGGGFVGFKTFGDFAHGPTNQSAIRGDTGDWGDTEL